MAKSKNNVIGNKNDLPWYLPNDLAHFRKTTEVQAVIMGRKTFESIVARLKKPLPNRKNIVISRDNAFSFPGVVAVHSIADAVKAANRQGFIIGGSQIYQLGLPLADRLYITEVQAKIDGDSYFPEIESSQWGEVSRESHPADELHPYPYDFVVYDRIKSDA